MNVVDDPNATARLEAVVGTAPRDAVWLVVEANGAVDVVPVAEGGSVVVGRGDDADVKVDAAGVSRAHARFAVKAGAVVVADLHSKNGTQHGGKTLPAGVDVALSAGDVVVVGAVRVVVAGGRAARGLLPHARFAAAVDDEFARARLFARPLTLALVDVGAAEGAVAAAAVAVGRALRSVDRAGLYGKSVIEVLWVEADAAAATALLSPLTAALPTAKVALASWPAQASSPAALFAAAVRGLRGGLVDADDADDAGAAGAAGAAGPVVASSEMQAVMALAARLSRSRLPALIHGETGVGKEVVARAIHGRGGKPLVAVNCAAVAPTLLESVLFGHEKGAFTGADAVHKGVFEQAHGSTLFLDEIAELSPGAQAALLRVLESRTVRRVGGSKDIDVDVRVLGASHQDLAALVEAGRFRKDLLYRLNALVVDVPPLRARPADIAPLAQRFTDEIAARDRRALRLDDDAVAALRAWPWPGNVRELRNVIERAALLSDDGVITSAELPPGFAAPAPTSAVASTPAAPLSSPAPSSAASSAAPSSAASSAPSSAASSAAPAPSAAPLSSAPSSAAASTSAAGPAPGALQERLERLEAEILTATLQACGGDTGAAAAQLQMPRRTLQHRLKVLGLR